MKLKVGNPPPPSLDSRKREVGPSKAAPSTFYSVATRTELACFRKAVDDDATSQLKRLDNHLQNGEDTDDVVRVTGEEGLAISRPSERETLGVGGVLANTGELGLELVDDALGLEVEDLDARGGGSAEPVTVGGEDKGVDSVTSLKGVEVLAVRELPEHGDAVLAAGGAERTIGRDGNGVDVTGVAVVVGLQLALAELPDLLRYVTKDRGEDLEKVSECSISLLLRSRSERGQTDLLPPVCRPLSSLSVQCPCAARPFEERANAQ